METLNTCGEIRLMSVREPTLVGARLMSDVWTMVQFSPLKPHRLSSGHGGVFSLRMPEVLRLLSMRTHLAADNCMEVMRGRGSGEKRASWREGELTQ